MKGIYQATWSESQNGEAVEFELCDLTDIGGHLMPLKGTTTHHTIEVSDEISDNDDTDAVLSLIKKYCIEKGIELREISKLIVK